jgi:hypothetical protein
LVNRTKPTSLIIRPGVSRTAGKLNTGYSRTPAASYTKGLDWTLQYEYDMIVLKWGTARLLLAINLFTRNAQMALGTLYPVVRTYLHCSVHDYLDSTHIQ